MAECACAPPCIRAGRFGTPSLPCCFRVKPQWPRILPGAPSQPPAIAGTKAILSPSCASSPRSACT
jgi:hypothetical protein